MYVLAFDAVLKTEIRRDLIIEISPKIYLWQSFIWLPVFRNGGIKNLIAEGLHAEAPVAIAVLQSTLTV